MGEKLTRRALDAWFKSESKSQWLWCGELRGFGARIGATAAEPLSSSSFEWGAAGWHRAAASYWANTLL